VHRTWATPSIQDVTKEMHMSRWICIRLFLRELVKFACLFNKLNPQTPSNCDVKDSDNGNTTNKKKKKTKVLFENDNDNVLYKYVCRFDRFKNLKIYNLLQVVNIWINFHNVLLQLYYDFICSVYRIYKKITFFKKKVPGTRSFQNQNRTIILQ